MRLILFLVILTFILSGCAIRSQRYSIAGSELLSYEQAVAALVKEPPLGTDARGLDQPTRILHAVPYAYPSEARRAGIEGRVMVGIEVDELGNVASTTIIGESPKVLADAAVAALKQWKFRPHTYRGVPVKVRFRQPITFKLTPPVDPAPSQ